MPGPLCDISGSFVIIIIIISINIGSNSSGSGGSSSIVVVAVEVLVVPVVVVCCIYCSPVVKVKALLLQPLLSVFLSYGGCPLDGSVHCVSVYVHDYDGLTSIVIVIVHYVGSPLLLAVGDSG